MNGPLSRLPRITDGVSKRISSYDPTGGNADYRFVAPGETKTLAEIEGSGAITHLWFTLWSEKDPAIRSHVILRCYWDGSEHPSIEAPIGEFFGNAWGENYEFQSLPLICGPRDGRAMTCYFPMPFAEGARIEVLNQSEHALDRIYFYIDYEHRPVFPDEGRFHAQYRQEFTRPATPAGEHDALTLEVTNPSDTENYVFCETNGKGHFIGVNLYVQSPTPLWYGEGDDMFRIDGESYPFSLHGTGTEDYFNTAWSPDNHFTHPVFGLARVPGHKNKDFHFWWLGRAHCYRFHLDDPIRFQKSLRASLEHGHANTLSLMLSSVSYWYQQGIAPAHPPLPPAAERVPLRPIIDQDVHNWRAHAIDQTGDHWGIRPGR